jgi:hypothetical protein
MSKGLKWFLCKTGDRQGCSRAIQTRINVGNETVFPGDCHDSNSAIPPPLSLSTSKKKWTHVVFHMTLNFGCLY